MDKPIEGYKDALYWEFVALESQKWTREEIRAELRRELRLRQRVYPKSCQRGTLTVAQAARQMALLQAGIEELAPPELQQNLFDLER